MGNFLVFVFFGLIRISLSKDSSGNGDVNTIFFRHYSNDSHTDINIQDTDTLKRYLEQSDCSTIYVHGFSETVNSESVQTVTNAYLNYTNINILAIDYSQLINKDYFTAVGNVDRVGKALADCFNKLYNAGFRQLECLHLVGHSLGGQVCGRIAKYVNFDLDKITGLDPAGPTFTEENSLNASNAKFVDIIHTDAGLYGTLYNLGSVNFLPNYGHRIQPGCPLLTIPFSHEEYCSHHRSWVFFAESIKNPTGFVGVKCDNSFQFALGLCNYTNTAVMGFAVPRNISGNYYLQTNANSPFARGEAGVRSDLSSIF